MRVNQIVYQKRLTEQNYTNAFDFYKMIGQGTITEHFSILDEMISSKI